QEITNTIPMGRIAEADDLVGTALYLASDLSDFVTGEIITVDGGAMA
ncbi:MAG: SDR family oxidoreductase, partial [Deltaproteobacteria bacterium]|nr:SDR family oxidoreductase [Deltaproteobacteria bacterium]